MAGEVPSGTVTFLFTDIEDSTHLVEALGDTYEVVLTEQRRIVTDAVADHGGHDMGAEGDGGFFAFARATEALAAALAAQISIGSHNWPAPVRVRMGIHSGEARYSLSTYIGIAVHKAQRICAAGHGGQVLLSSATREVATLPPAAALRDLGDHLLKDLGEPERIYQLVHPSLDDDFPPLRTLDHVPNNLPPQVTSFIGRDREIRDTVALLTSSRLVTLTGPGGVGKTRLALHAAASALEAFPDGVWMADLASVSDPDLVPKLVASAVGIREREPGPGQSELRPIHDRLVDALRTRRALVIFDNCEHLTTACAELVRDVLAACPRVAVLATSREPLGLRGEITRTVPPLGDADAVGLFSDRATQRRADFALTDHNAASVAEVCRRLDGIPLAIELAAALMRVLSPAQIAERLDNRFGLLVAGHSGGPPRHETLRATVDWSYDLLPAAEGELLARLSVFVGSFTLEATERVCSGEGVERDDILGLVVRLVDRSLVVAQPAGTSTRYRLLDTIQSYAWERLREDDVVSTAAPSTFVFRRDGEYWTIGRSDNIFRLRDAKGLAYLRALLAEPGRELHVLDFAGGAPGGRVAQQIGLDVLDDTARATYRARLVELEEEVAEARAWNDTARAASAQQEVDALTEQLAGAVGLGGRSRRTSSAVERARTSVRKAIAAALERIEQEDSELGMHLRVAVRTGTYCSYAPDPTASVQWTL